MTLRLFSILMILAILFVGASATKATPTKQEKTLVEVWCGGDDGLTIGLRDNLEGRFNSSLTFRLSSGKKPGTLVVTIPSNVGWKKVGDRTRVLYNVEYSSYDGQFLGKKTGSCWEDALEDCTTQIVKDAKKDIHKAHSEAGGPDMAD